MFKKRHLKIFSVRNQGVGCALAWVTIARDSESDYPFYPVVQFRRVRAGHLWCQISSGSTKLSLNVNSGSYCTSIIVGSRVMVNTCCLIYSLLHYVDSETSSVRKQGVGCVLGVGYYSTWLWIRLSILSCGAIPQDSCRSLIFSLPIGGEIMWQLFFESLNSFYSEMRLNKFRPSGRLV